MPSNAHDILWTTISSIREDHQHCLGQNSGGCPWRNFHEYDSGELARELLASGYDIVPRQEAV